MAVDPTDFFDDKQGAAVLKHGILRRYLAVFASKVGSTAPDHKVMYLDAYAGPGEYHEGEGGEGSPAIARATAELLAKNRDLVGIYVEKNRVNRERLEAFLGDSEHQHHVLAGSIEEKFDEVLGLVGKAPLLAFFDPFGLTVPMVRLKQLMERPWDQGGIIRPYATTDIIIHVSYTAIRRLCGMLTSERANPKQRATIVERCDEKFGGNWWHEIATDRPENWAEKIAHGYAKRLRERIGGVGWYRTRVRDRPDGPVAYELLLVSRFTEESNWQFNEAVSLANDDVRKFFAQHDPQEALPIDETQWVATIQENIVKLLRKGPVKVRDEWEEIYGDTFGLARSLHIRKAIKNLFKAKLTLCNGVGDVPALVITPAPQAK